MHDASLLQRYAAHKDAEAFARIVEQYQRLVLATCRRTLRNAGDVDDAVQETFLRLAQRAKQLHSNLGGWLHRCAVSVSIDINRRRETRQRHEAAAVAQPYSGESAQQELAELREHLDTALAKLDADARELIVQRYFAGRPQVELAAELGIAPSTLSERLDRAIAALRGHLKSSGCVAAGASLTALLAAEHSSASVASALTANLMKIGLGGIGAAGAVGGVSFSAAALTACFSLAVCVILLAGVRFLLGQTALPSAVATTQTTVAAPATAPAAAMTVLPADHAGAPAPPRWQAAADDSDAVFAGHVLDRKGKPIANATILLSPGPTAGSATTDENGQFAIQKIDRPGTFTVGARADGYVEIQPFRGGPAMQLAPDAHVRRDIVMDRGVNVEVRVLDESGTGFGDVDVDANPTGGPRGTGLRQTKTDRDGKVTFVLPISKAPWTITATSETWAPAHVLVTPDDPDQPKQVDVKMTPSLNAAGVAMCKDGKPAAGWQVYAQPDWWVSNFIPKQEKIDADGNFTLTEVGAGNYQMWLSIGNTSRPVGNVKLPTTQPIRLDLPMVSPSAWVKVKGLIAFEGKRPAYVLIDADSDDGQSYGSNTNFNGGGGAARGVARNQFQYTIDLPPGTYRFNFRTQSGEQSLDKVQVPGDVPLMTLKSTEKPRMSGTVVDAATGEAITHFAVRLRKSEAIGNGPNYVQDAQWIQVSNPDGHFDADLVGPGVYMAQVSSDGYAWSWGAAVRIENGNGTTTVKLTRGGNLTGQVLDPTGKPVAGAKVIPLSMARAVSTREFDRFESEAGAVTTDNSGKFTLTHLCAGDESVKILAPDFAPLIVGGLKVMEGQTADGGAMTLSIGGAVEGVVYDASGAPAAGVELQFQDADGYGGEDDERTGRVADEHTDEKGHYHVEHLNPEILYVNLADRWQHDGVVRRVFRPMLGKTVQFDLGGTAAVRGRLLAGGAPIAGRRVELAAGSEYFGPVTAYATTDADGRFTFFGPPPGHYTFYVAANANGQYISLREVDITPASSDLGDIAQDVGDVVISFTADDPQDIKSVRYVSVGTWDSGVLWSKWSAAASLEGDRWRATGVPAGKFAIFVNSLEYLTQFHPIERKPGAVETAAEFHLPHLGATLTIASTQESVVLRNEENTVQAQGAPNTPMKLPAGTYHLLVRATAVPRVDVDAIVLKDGDSKTVQLPPGEGAGDLQSIAIRVWESSGAMSVGLVPRLLDEKGNAVIGNYGGESTRFDARAGKYRAVIERAGAANFEQEITVPATPNPKGTIIDVVLP